MCVSGFVSYTSHAMLGKDYHIPFVRETKKGMNIEKGECVRVCERVSGFVSCASHAMLSED